MAARISRAAYADFEFDVPVPFACTQDFKAGGGGTVRHVNHKRVPQCALSRICGMCGETLGRPLAFLGTELEVGRNAFHFPPLHEGCAEAAGGLYVAVGDYQNSGNSQSMNTLSGKLLRIKGRGAPRSAAARTSSSPTCRARRSGRRCAAST